MGSGLNNLASAKSSTEPPKNVKSVKTERADAPFSK